MVVRRLRQFEQRLDFNRDIIRKRAHAYRASHPDSIVFSPILGKQFAASIDDIGVALKLRNTIHHPQHFYYPFDLVQAAEVGLQRSEDGQPDLACSQFTFLHVKILSDPSNDQAFVFLDCSVPGHIYIVSTDEKWLVYTEGSWCGWKF